MKKQCASCPRPATGDSRYCFICKANVRYELVHSNYLTKPEPTRRRAPGSGENRAETHDGVDL